MSEGAVYVQEALAHLWLRREGGIGGRDRERGVEAQERTVSHLDLVVRPHQGDGDQLGADGVPYRRLDFTDGEQHALEHAAAEQAKPRRRRARAGAEMAAGDLQ